MKWVEIITLRSPGNINRELIDELLKGVGQSDSPTDAPKDLVGVKEFERPCLLESEPGSQHKSPRCVRFSSALKPLGLLSRSIWIETAALGFPRRDGDSELRDIRERPC